MRRSQNVSAPVAVVIIAATLVVFFLVFNRERPEVERPSKQVPEPPPIEEKQVSDMFKGLSPIGLVAVVPALPDDRGQGLRVAMVAPHGPAQLAGVQPGDLIVSFSGKEVVAQEELSFYLNRVDPKQTYPMVVNRSGKFVKLAVTGLVPLPPEEQVKY